MSGSAGRGCSDALRNAARGGKRGLTACTPLPWHSNRTLPIATGPITMPQPGALKSAAAAAALLCLAATAGCVALEGDLAPQRSAGGWRAALRLSSHPQPNSIAKFQIDASTRRLAQATAPPTAPGAAAAAAASAQLPPGCPCIYAPPRNSNCTFERDAGNWCVHAHGIGL